MWGEADPSSGSVAARYQPRPPTRPTTTPRTSRPDPLLPTSNHIPPDDDCDQPAHTESTLYIALPIGQRIQCPLCLAQGICVIRKRDGIRRHLNTTHGPGWELTYVCCGISFSCRAHRYAIKRAKAHFFEHHAGALLETDDDLCIAASSLNLLEEKLQGVAAPSTSPLVMARSAAAIHRNNSRHSFMTSNHSTMTSTPTSTTPQTMTSPQITTPPPISVTTRVLTTPTVSRARLMTISPAVPTPAPSPRPSAAVAEPRPPAATAEPEPPALVAEPRPPAVVAEPGPPALGVPRDNDIVTPRSSTPVPAPPPVQPMTPTVAAKPRPPATSAEPEPPAVVAELRPPAAVAEPGPPALGVPGPLGDDDPPDPDDDDDEDIPPPPRDDDMPADVLTAWQREWISKFPPNIEWNNFLTTLQDLISSLSPQQPKRRPRPTNARPRQETSHRRPPQTSKEAARVQRLYRTAPKRAMREILEEASPFCTIPEENIVAHFRESYAPKDGCLGNPPHPTSTLPTATAPPALLDPATPEEIARLLRRTSNTAPGPDGVRYSIWRRRDSSGHVLAAVFNICLTARRFPPAWKQSNTVLIHKKGATDDITNWRPIALSDTAGKLLCSLLADRLSTWAVQHHHLSWAQKGFTPSEGCLEHNFVLQELLDDSRRRGSDVCMAWLDLANAFGSVPHTALFSALRSAGVPDTQLQILEDLYRGSSTTIRHNSGTTPNINFGAGVRQGCPLSPILFNMVMEALIRPIVALEQEHGARLHGTPLSILAYADDLAIVAKSPDSLQALLDAVSEAASWVGLRFKPPKCASLHIAKRSTRDTAFHIYGSPLQILRDGDAYQHLGVPTGFRVDQTPSETISRLEAEAEKIFSSALAPWQKLHAARTFLIPQLDFNLRTARVKKTQLRQLDNVLKKGCKSVLNLPSRASAELAYLPPSWGGAGLLPLGDQADLASVGHAFRLLTAPDPKVKHWAIGGLAISSGLSIAQRPDMDHLVSYLNGEIPGNSNTTSTFSTARTAFNRLKKPLPDLRWGYSRARGTFELTIPGEKNTLTVDRGSRSALAFRMRASMQLHYRATLNSKPDQGRVARVTTTSNTSNHMLHEGRYTRFADWRFLHRARLNTLPLNGCRRWGDQDRRCRRCGRQDETTAHVLCHCLPAMPNITRRHNAVLDFLTSAIRTPGEVRVNKRVPLQTLLPRQDIPEEIARCRPDLVVVDENRKTIKIVDVTIPYEDGWQSITAAREKKLTIYAPLAQLLQDGGYRTTVEAFVVGSLGAWDTANWSTLAHLGVSKRYATTLSRRCVSEVIRWSRDIYVQHVTGVQQRP